ncbi:MAG: hypothetical protein KF846_13615 [Cyclobacteriaceae bacterium]|nr:hypothetical protein [Cyclobacteriaceae bacterium]MBX2957195.1 hypothetical protein [Cyclobacteriaceae bacterium]
MRKLVQKRIQKQADKDRPAIHNPNKTNFFARRLTSCNSSDKESLLLIREITIISQNLGRTKRIDKPFHFKGRLLLHRELDERRIVDPFQGRFRKLSLQKKLK